LQFPLYRLVEIAPDPIDDSGLQAAHRAVMCIVIRDSAQAAGVKSDVHDQGRSYHGAITANQHERHHVA